MGYSSLGGVTIFRTQTAKGVTAADIDTEGMAVRLLSGAMAGNRELLIPDPEMGGNRDVSDGLGGPISYGTDYEFNLRFNFIATFLKAALGSAATTGTAAEGYTHTFTPTDTSELPYLTIFERISDGLDFSMYTDCVVNTFHLETDPGSYLTGTVGIIGREQVAGVPDIPTTGLYDNTTMTVGTNVLVKYNGTDVAAKSFSIDINNNFEDDDFRLGSFFLKDLTPKRREVTMSMNLRHENKDKMRQALLGSPTATTPQGITTKFGLSVEITTFENIPGTTPPKRYSLTLTIPQCIFEPAAFEPSGDDVLETEFSVRAVRPNPATPILTAVLVNGKEEIA